MTVLLMMQTNSGIAVSDQKIFKKKLTLVLIVNNEHATGSAWKKRVQKHSPATHREVQGNPKPPSPELVSLAWSEHCGLVRL